MPRKSAKSTKSGKSASRKGSWKLRKPLAMRRTPPRADPWVHRFVRYNYPSSLQNDISASTWTQSYAGSTTSVACDPSPIPDFMPYTVMGGFAFGHTLWDVQGYSEFISLFDSYKIEKVEVTIQLTTGSSTNGAQAQAPTITYATDYDDNSIEVLGAILQKKGCKVVQLTTEKPLVITYKPKLANVVFTNSVGNAYTQASEWVDMSNQQVPWYGLKGFIQNFQTSPSPYTPICKITFNVRYFLAFKGPR